MRHHIRFIEPQDNAAVKAIVLQVLTDFGCIGPGYASNDPEINDMYTTYQETDSRYWVIEDLDTRKIIGGGGFSRLRGTTVEEGICELQKLYFLPEVRGLGLGKALMERILETATSLGYQEMYLESIPEMLAAISLYQKYGFQRLDEPKGATGHTACPVYMGRLLQASQAILF